MKKLLTISSLLLLVPASMSFAASGESASVQFLDPVRLGTTNLPAGSYNVRWDAGSPEVQLMVSGHGKKLSVPAGVSATGAKDEVLTHRDGSADVVDSFTVKSTKFTIK